MNNYLVWSIDFALIALALVLALFLPRLWECRCDCGKTKAIAGQYLRSGSSKSCGCLRGPRRPKDIPAMKVEVDRTHFSEDWMFLGQGDTLSLRRPLRTTNGDWI